MLGIGGVKKPPRAADRGNTVKSSLGGTIVGRRAEACEAAADGTGSGQKGVCVMVRSVQGFPLVVNPRVVVAFVTAVRVVIRMLSGLEAAIGSAAVKADNKTRHEVSCVIGLSGPITGHVVVSFEKEAAGMLASAFAGTVVGVDSPAFPGTMGEVASQVAQTAKTDLGEAIEIAEPRIVLGKGTPITQISAGPSLIVPCETVAGAFAVEVRFGEAAQQ